MIRIEKLNNKYKVTYHLNGKFLYSMENIELTDVEKFLDQERIDDVDQHYTELLLTLTNVPALFDDKNKMISAITSELGA